MNSNQDYQGIDQNQNSNPVINILISSITTSEQDIMSELVLEMLRFNITDEADEADEADENAGTETPPPNTNDDISSNNSVEEENQQQETTNIDDINTSNAIRRSISGLRQWVANQSREFIYTPYSIFNHPSYETMTTTTAANTFVENVILQSLNQTPTYKKVISDEGKNDLKKMPYKKNELYNTSCPILMVDFEEDQEVIVLPCNHCFLPEAIEKWLEEEKAECPVCRLKLKSKEVKNIQNVSNEATTRAIQTNQNSDIPRNRQSLFRSLNNSYSSYSYLEHPYGPRPERTVIPHSYIPVVEDNITTEELNDIELAILLSLTTQ